MSKFQTNTDEKDQEIIAYSDGACFGNPGPGGWAAVLLWKGKRKEISGGFRLTTNNRMEILAAIEALRAIKTDKRYKVKLHSDSRLLCDAINKKWIYGWEQKNWIVKGSEKRLNYDLWSDLLDECDKHDVSFQWVAGHAGIPENERCDVLSKAAAAETGLPRDVNYEKSQTGK